MSKRKPKRDGQGSAAGRELVSLRWGCASEAERKAVGKALAEARKTKREAALQLAAFRNP